MLRKYVSPKHLILYFASIVITWLEAIITPALVQYIVESFTNRRLEFLWQVLIWGIGANLILLLGLAGKRYYYARLITDFKSGIKRAIFKTFLQTHDIEEQDILSDIENDVDQLQNSYIEPTVIIISSIGFTSVSILYALWTNLYLGLVFIIFYSIPVLLSKLGSKKLDKISEMKSQANQGYLSSLSNFIGGIRQIRYYQGQALFFKHFNEQLGETLKQEIEYEKQRTVNSLIINSIDAFCSVAPIVIGGFMTYYRYLDAASFVGIYLVSHNIGYQFQELAYFINTRKSSEYLSKKYQGLLSKHQSNPEFEEREVFPIQIDKLSVESDGTVLLAPVSAEIHSGEKIAIIGESGSEKTTLLNCIFGERKGTDGGVYFAGKSLAREQIYQVGSYILQSSHYFDDLSLEENIALDSKIDVDKMRQVLRQTGLEYLRDSLHRNATLSGGEKQRLEIARALYHDSDFIIADEIKSNLDAKNIRLITEILLSLPQTVIEVIHHYTEVDLDKYDKVINLSTHDFH